VSDLVGAIEIGGSHVSACRVDVARACVEPPGIRRFDLDAGGSREALLGAISGAALEVKQSAMRCAGVATAGPFDYERGVAQFRGVAKLESLYGVDLRERLSRDLGLEPPQRVRFLNDAHAFVLGEWWTGAAKGHARAMGLTLGTGLGSGFLADGRIVVSGSSIPPEARLDLVPFRGAAVEDVLSSRGILAAFGAKVDVVEIARRARSGEPSAAGAFRGFGAALGEFLEPWVVGFAPTCLVFGGSITRAWDLFADAFGRSCPEATRLRFCGPAARLDEAPLLGAALHAMRGQSETS
jgi:glucokinase